MNLPAADLTTTTTVKNESEIVKPIIDPKVYNQLSSLLGDDWKNCFTNNGLCTMHKLDGTICGKSMDTSSFHSRMKHIYSFHYIEFAQLPKSLNRLSNVRRKTMQCKANNRGSIVKKITKKIETDSFFGPEIISFFVSSVRTNPELLERSQLIELNAFLNEYLQETKDNCNNTIESRPLKKKENATAIPKKSERERKKKLKDSELVKEQIFEKHDDENDMIIVSAFEMDDQKRRSIWNL